MQNGIKHPLVLLKIFQVLYSMTQTTFTPILRWTFQDAEKKTHTKMKNEKINKNERKKNTKKYLSSKYSSFFKILTCGHYKAGFL